MSRLATLCVTTMTVRPSLASRFIISITDLSSPGSRPEVGSSRNSRDGLVSSSRATLTRFCWPPDSAPARVCACFFSPSSSMTSVTRLRRSAFEVSPGNRSSAA